jgi:hypothetical protein
MPGDANRLADQDRSSFVQVAAIHSSTWCSSSLSPIVAVELRLAPEALRAGLLSLPWDLPLEEWPESQLLPVRSRGISRHIVRFVGKGEAIFALKEMPDRLVRREYELLGEMAEQNVPVVSVAGWVLERGDNGSGPDQGILVTRYLDFSLPYRIVLGDPAFGLPVETLLDALAELLVRLHLAGFFWGDCSLSNTLFRRDAGALAAYLVDAETAEHHEELTDGQRRHDLELAEERIAGELADLLAGNLLADATLDPVEVAESVRHRYERLWTELVRKECFAIDEGYRIEERIRRLNELGFDVSEVRLRTTEHGIELTLSTQVVEPGHHRRTLAALTGLDVQENQARRLLNDLSGFRAYLERKTGRKIPLAVAATRWLDEVYEPTIAAIPPELNGKLEPAEFFHQVLDHRWFLSEAKGRDVGIDVATRSFVEQVLPYAPDEQLLVATRGTVPTPALEHGETGSS